MELADGGLGWLIGIAGMRLADCDWRIRIGGLRCNPPFLRGGASKSGGLDFEVARRCEEVQKERERAADWTLKRRGDVRKSKRSEKERRIGL